ncbi:hypothetical protein [Nostoc sp. CCY0012]|uniref:hypothetical protein n=1 Tax=Nostoc sp. CCY0012 TaxID=1056123 RepID=UPI0039C6AFDE
MSRVETIRSVIVWAGVIKNIGLFTPRVTKSILSLLPQREVIRCSWHHRGRVAGLYRYNPAHGDALMGKFRGLNSAKS